MAGLIPEPALTPREQRVLTAIIEMYISDGEPASSRAVAHHLENKEGMSAATIRNVMAALDGAGLLEQPHTSAGRIPTARAFRIYANLIPTAQTPSPMLQGRIETSLAGINSPQDYLERTSRLLATLSSGLGIALAMASGPQQLEHIHFSRLAQGRVLAVVVTQGGGVQDRLLHFDRDLGISELEMAARYLNENFRGWQIERIRAEILRRIEIERSEYMRPLASVEELCRHGALDTVEQTATIYVEGMANLVSIELDRERLRQMLTALDTKQQLADLLAAYVDGSRQGVRVVVSPQMPNQMPNQPDNMQDLVLFGAPASFGTQGIGTVAVLAPTRVQYQEMIHAVGYIAQLSERLLEFPSQ